MTKILHFLAPATAAVALLVFSPAMASAATIVWQPSVNMYQGATVQTFVDTTGDPLVGFNGTNDSADGNVTVNGVSFTQAGNNSTVVGGGGESITVNGNNVHGSAFEDGEFSGDADIFHLIRGGVWGATSVDLAGLTVGAPYLVQVFTNDARSSRDANSIAGFGDGSATGAVGISALNNSPGGGTADDDNPEAGDSIIGTFIADATTQSFQVFGTNSGDINDLAMGDSRAHVNAIQLRAIPEPASLALLALGSMAMLGVRRHA